MIFSPAANDTSSGDPNSSSLDDIQYLLVCQAQASSVDHGTWSFSLETINGQLELSAEDEDLGDLNRLTLLAAVRGLESIEGGASVTLLSNNRYLIRSLTDSLPRWRDRGFVWEHFGRRIDVQHADLWRRIDGALRIHRVQACLLSSRWISVGEDAKRSAVTSDETESKWRVDSAHQVPRPKRAASAKSEPSDSLRRWLLGSADRRDVPRSRITAADLAESY